MKILFLANSDVGLYKFRKELIEKLVEQKQEVYVSVPAGMFINDINAIGCNVIINNYLERRGTNIKHDLKLIHYYMWLLKRVKPDVVLTYTIKPNVYGGLVCTFLKVPYIVNVTGLGTSIENKGVLRFIALALYKVGLKKAQTIFFQNEENLKYMLKYHIVKKEKCKRIPGSGVNTSQHCYEPYPKYNEKIIFTTIGRIMRDKGINEVLGAAEKIKKKYPDTIFRLIGDFDEEYKDKVKGYEKLGIVSYIAQQKEVHPFIAESHAIIHASYHEGMSNVLLEAASAGRPVIATDVHGCIEIFEPDKTGIAFQAGNTISLINAVEKFLSLSYEEKEIMGKAGRIKIEKEFDRNIVVEKYIKEIEKISEAI